MTRIVPTAARYEAATRTIRSVPENYWLATMDSWDGAVDHVATAHLLAAAPRLFAALQKLASQVYVRTPGDRWPLFSELYKEANEALAEAEGAGQ